MKADRNDMCVGRACVLSLLLINLQTQRAIDRTGGRGGGAKTAALARKTEKKEKEIYKHFKRSAFLFLSVSGPL